MARPALLRPFLGTLATNGVIVLIGMATGILSARLLGPEQRGALAVLLFWPGLLAGIGFLSLGEGAVYRRHATELEASRFESTVFWLAAVLAAVSVLPATLTLPFLMGEERADLVPVARAYLLLFLPFNFLALALLALDQAELRFRRFNLLRILPSAVYLLGMLLLWAIGTIDAVSFLWASWLGTVVTAALRMGARWRHLLHWPDPAEASALLRRAGGFHLTALLGILGMQMDRLLVVRLFDDVQIGYYVVALTLAATALNGFASAVSTVLFPAIATERDRSAALARLASAMRYTVLATLLCMFALVVTIPWLLPLLFGTAFSEAAPLAVLLSLALAPSALRQVLVRSLRAFGDARAGVLSEGATVAAFFLFALPAIAWLGLPGVPLALLGANLAGLWVIAHRLERCYGLGWCSWIRPRRMLRIHLKKILFGLGTPGSAP